MGYKLLLADDSITIQKVVGIIFANEDYQLAVVDNGTAALEKARELLPDVIMVDALMPGKSGYDVCREVRQDRELSHIPILLLVGAFEPFDEEKARNSGADDHLSKPFESQNLIEKVKKLLQLGEERGKADKQPDFSIHKEVSAAAAGVPVECGLDSLNAVEAEPGDDLWGTFEVVEAAEGEDVHLGEILEENEYKPEIIDTVEEFEPFVFREDTEFDGIGVFSSGADTVEVSEVLEPSRGLTGEYTENGICNFVASPSERLLSDDLESPLESSFVHAAPGIQFSPEGADSGSAEVFPCDGEPGEPVAGKDADAGSISLSEEQLAGIVAKVSREIIEKIAWEVVPDLAETIIREEIRKIREGS